MGLSVSYEPTEWEEGGGGRERENGGWRMELKEVEVSFLAPDIWRCLTLFLVSPLFSSSITPTPSVVPCTLTCVCVCEKDDNVFIQLFIVNISLNKSNTVTALIRSVPGRFLYLNIHGFRQVAHFHHIWRLFLHFKAVMTQGWLHGVRNPVCSDYSWVLPPLDLCQ